MPRLDSHNVGNELRRKVDVIKEEVNLQKADLIYQTPTIVGSQIQIIKHSNVNRLYFKLDTNLTGNITISLDGGVAEKPLKDIEGVQLTELEKGFVEVVADASFFTLRSRSGLSSADRQSLIDIVNRGLSNESDLKTSVINAFNTVNTEGVKISTSALWGDILTGIPNIKTGKKWASGSAISDTSGSITVSSLTFKPTVIIARITQTNGALYQELFSNNSVFYFSTASMYPFSNMSGYVNSRGFKIPSGTGSGSITTTWIAFE